MHVQKLEIKILIILDYPSLTAIRSLSLPLSFCELQEFRSIQISNADCGRKIFTVVMIMDDSDSIKSTRMYSPLDGWQSNPSDSCLNVRNPTYPHYKYIAVN